MLRGGEPLPERFVSELHVSAQRGEAGVIAARSGGEVVGVALVYYRLNVSAGGRFASIEEMQVRSENQGKGIGRELLKAVEETCAGRNVSYIEVQTDDAAGVFYESCGFESEPEVRVLSRSVAFSGGPAAGIRSL